MASDAPPPSKKVKKCRQYDLSYLEFGFIPSPNDNTKPMCLICGSLFSNEAMKPSRLKDHHTTYIKKSSVHAHTVECACTKVECACTKVECACTYGRVCMHKGRVCMHTRVIFQKVEGAQKVQCKKPPRSFIDYA